MGIEYSSESQEGLPVTGLPNSLEVLKVQLHDKIFVYLLYSRCHYISLVQDL